MKTLLTFDQTEKARNPLYNKDFSGLIYSQSVKDRIIYHYTNEVKNEIR